MIGVRHKHRYFRIQVAVTLFLFLGLSLSGLATDGSPLPNTNASTGPFDFGHRSLVTWVPVLGGATLSYFFYGRIRFRRLMVATILCYAAVWSVFLVGPVFEAQIWFMIANGVGVLVFGGCVALIGKVTPVYPIFAAAYAYWQSRFDLIGLSPMFSTLSVNEMTVQWGIVGVLAVTSILADQ